MLERPTLWLSPVTDAWPLPAGDTGGRVRVLLDPAGQEVVGHIVLPRRSWRPWRRGRPFAVYEAPDASLVCNGLILGWPERLTTVQDADARLVAVVRDGSIFSPGGGVWAVYRPATPGASGRFVGPGGELAHWEADRGGMTLRFGRSVQDEPFLKMGMLAVVLSS
jgi:hypothetical protein